MAVFYFVHQLVQQDLTYVNRGVVYNFQLIVRQTLGLFWLKGP